MVAVLFRECPALDTEVHFGCFFAHLSPANLFLLSPENTSYSHSSCEVKSCRANIIQQLLHSQYFKTWEEEYVPTVHVRKQRTFHPECKRTQTQGKHFLWPSKSAYRKGLNRRPEETLPPNSSWMRAPPSWTTCSIWGLCMLDPCSDIFTWAKPWLCSFQWSQTWVNQPPSDHPAWFKH